MTLCFYWYVCEIFFVMLGEKIRKIRNLKGYSQEYVADRLKISQSAYSAIETNKTELDIGRMKQIAEILEIDFLELISSDKGIFF